MTNALNLRQAFDLEDVLLLEVERDPVGSELVNIVPNPKADGAWGWTTPVPNTRMTAAGGVFTFTTTPSQPAYFTSDTFAIVPGGWAAAAWEVTGGTAAYHRVRFEWLDVNKNLISRSDMTGYMSAAAVTRYAAAQVVSGAFFARVRFDIYNDLYGANPTAGRTLSFQKPRIVSGADSPIVVRSNLLGMATNFETDINGVTSTSTGASAVNWPALTRQASGSGGVGSWCLRSQHFAGTDDRMSLTTSDGVTFLPIPVNPSTSYTFSLYTKAGTTPRAVGIDVQWRSTTGAVTNAAASPTSNNTTGWTRKSRTLVSPADAEAAYLTWFVNAPAANELHYWDGLMVEASNVLGTFIEGTVLVSGALPDIPAAYFTPITADIRSIGVKRPELDLGTMTVTVASDSLDPAVSPLIRPGRKTRLSVTPDLAAPTVWEELFTGTIGKPQASYDLLKVRGAKALTTFTATDPVSAMATTGQPSGVGTIANLPAVLEGAGVAWNVNGSTDQVAAATVVSYDENASVLDQVVRTRDSVLGYAWVDRKGRLQAWDASSISTAVADVLNEDVYNGEPVIDYDTEKVINTVTVVLTDASGTETTYGPYVDTKSVRLNGVQPMTFSVQGISPAAIPTYAQNILTANATPTRRVGEVVIPIRTSNLSRTVRDLYDLVQVVNERASIDDLMRITNVEHLITPATGT